MLVPPLLCGIIVINSHSIHLTRVRCHVISDENIIEKVKNDVAKKLGRRVREMRNKRGITQQKLAELSTVDYKYIQKIEGKKPPASKIDTIARIAKALRIKVSRLVDF